MPNLLNTVIIWQNVPSSSETALLGTFCQMMTVLRRLGIGGGVG